MKKPKKINVFKNQNKNWKTTNLKIYLLVYGQQLIFNMGIHFTYTRQEEHFTVCMIAAREWREGRERRGAGLEKLLCRNEYRWERGQGGEGGVRKGRII